MNEPTRKQIADHLRTVNVLAFAKRHGIIYRTLLRVKGLRRKDSPPSKRTLAKIAAGIERDIKSGIYE